MRGAEVEELGRARPKHVVIERLALLSRHVRHAIDEGSDLFEFHGARL
jgi:hypothetical protein